MSVRIIAVPIADHEATRAALLKELAARLGVPCGTGGYAGIAGRFPDGTLAPPGLGEATQVCDERVSRDGVEVALLIDDAAGTEIVLCDGITGAEALRLGSLSGATVQGYDLPASKVVDEQSYFPDPEPSEDPGGGAAPEGGSAAGEPMIARGRDR